MEFATFKQSVSFSGHYDYDTCGVENGIRNFYTHRQNITECLREFSLRNADTAKYLIGTFGFTIEVVNPVHYNHRDTREDCRPHFNLKSNGK